MRQFNPFPKLLGHFGAVMGRNGDNPANIQGLRRLHARCQGGRDGYDRGGAYWGAPSNVWGVWGWIDNQPCCVYVRASSRIAAINKARRGDD
jgi:hypothetical protein